MGRNRNRGTEPGLATVRWCTHTVARSCPPVIAGVVVFGVALGDFNVKVLRCHQEPLKILKLAALAKVRVGVNEGMKVNKARSGIRY